MIESLKKYLKKLFNADISDILDLTNDELKLILKIRIQKLTYLTEKKLANIVKTCKQIENNNLPGIFIEAGCALGGSSILISSVKNSDRLFLVYDVFGMIPSPTKEDSQDVHDRYKIIVEGNSEGIEGDKYYGYEKNLYETVKNNFNKFEVNCTERSVELIQGLVQDTMNIDQSVAFAHVDVDWYEPVMICLERIFPLLVDGGCIILDDYHSWGGCRKATDEYLRKVSGQFVLNDTFEALTIIKKHR